ncbi:MAG: hypothetical protein ACT4PM_05100 [Gemmatimonadales bacterium]
MMGFSLVVVLVVSLAAATQAPPPCPDAGPPDNGWREALFVGLDLKLKVPAELRPVPYSSLGRSARRNEELGVPRSVRDSARLVAAWQVPERTSGEIRGVYLYQVALGTQLRGRGCGLTITGRSAIVSRHVLSGADRDQDQHWTEVSWPGFLLAAQGVSPSSFERALRIIGTVGPIR